MNKAEYLTRTNVCITNCTKHSMFYVWVMLLTMVKVSWFTVYYVHCTMYYMAAYCIVTDWNQAGGECWAECGVTGWCIIYCNKK